MGIFTATGKTILNAAQAVGKGTTQAAALATATGADIAGKAVGEVGLYALTMPGEQAAQQLRKQGAKLQNVGKQSMNSGAKFDPATKTYHE